MDRQDLIDALSDRLQDREDYTTTMRKCATIAVDLFVEMGVLSDASDEMVVEPVARAIYCAAHPELSSTWNAECAETRLHYFDLASAAIRAFGTAP